MLGSDTELSSAMPLGRAWYTDSIASFCEAPATEIFAQLANNRDFDLAVTQKDAWQIQIELLKPQLAGLQGIICLEFVVPRMGRRVDAVLVVGSLVFVLEFKVGETEFPLAAINQVWDYALDLKNFHEGSHHSPIIPILICTEAEKSASKRLQSDSDSVFKPLAIAPFDLRTTVEECISSTGETTVVNPDQWLHSSYRPTPTIIEAARTLYAKHSVESIIRNDAAAKNLSTTSKSVQGIIDDARRLSQKSICFVTGVPGAGKTLVGLNIATQRRDPEDSTHAVFLSGNGPLVAVLREALVRDEVDRAKQRGERRKKSEARKRVESFIQNIHHFRDEALKDPKPPSERVVIFDEAQRAWNLTQTSNFMRRKKGIPQFEASEPEFLIRYMDRHQDWAVIICLVGGGQEINIGEAGIGAWIEAVANHFPDWNLCISNRLSDSEYSAAHALENVRSLKRVHFNPDLHLAVSMRSFRAEKVSAFIKALLDCENAQAKTLFNQISSRFPIRITRDLASAKRWIRRNSRGTERIGLIASSKAMRLKPHAIDIRVSIDPVHWFLNERTDTRSSYYLEDAATEFQVQGLELDWTCVTWDADLRFNGEAWNFHDFRGDRWTHIRKEENRAFLKNAYRVLLTRARQGMVIFVPNGDSSDHTRSSSYYDETFDYLRNVGIPELDDIHEI